MCEQQPQQQQRGERGGQQQQQWQRLEEKEADWGGRRVVEQRTNLHAQHVGFPLPFCVVPFHLNCF
jgi:hypothetical protein